MDRANDTTADGRTRGGPAFWVMAGLSLLWNSFGAFDYTMTQTRNAAYLAAFTPEQRAYFDGLPAWMEALWACGVWGALLGSVLLLLRRRAAVWAFGLSLVGLAGSQAYQVMHPSPPMPPMAAVMTAIIWIVAIGLFLWARRLASAGVLR